MAKMMKTAVTIPKEDFKEMESLRKKLKKTRSEIISEAIHQWIQETKTAALEKKYAAGYRRSPEKESDPEELKAVAQLAPEGIESGDWNTEYSRWRDKTKQLFQRRMSELSEEKVTQLENALKSALELKS